ncbi:dentin sialophosphoprotein-like, partial [Mizuhopecten yessoensis]|uniref:dentin sialophosphoprotein-like n=1 Tax=Mizuhopecten yessoensis TaxID=6573 RepID=UPI000B459FCF
DVSNTSNGDASTTPDDDTADKSNDDTSGDDAGVEDNSSSSTNDDDNTDNTSDIVNDKDDGDDDGASTSSNDDDNDNNIEGTGSDSNNDDDGDDSADDTTPNDDTIDDSVTSNDDDEDTSDLNDAENNDGDDSISSNNDNDDTTSDNDGNDDDISAIDRNKISKSGSTFIVNSNTVTFDEPPDDDDDDDNEDIDDSSLFNSMEIPDLTESVIKDTGKLTSDTNDVTTGSDEDHSLLSASSTSKGTAVVPPQMSLAEQIQAQKASAKADNGLITPLFDDASMLNLLQDSSTSRHNSATSSSNALSSLQTNFLLQDAAAVSNFVQSRQVGSSSVVAKTGSVRRTNDDGNLLAAALGLQPLPSSQKQDDTSSERFNLGDDSDSNENSNPSEVDLQENGRSTTSDSFDDESLSEFIDSLSPAELDAMLATEDLTNFINLDRLPGAQGIPVAAFDEPSTSSTGESNTNTNNKQLFDIDDMLSDLRITFPQQEASSFIENANEFGSVMQSTSSAPSSTIKSTGTQSNTGIMSQILTGLMPAGFRPSSSGQESTRHETSKPSSKESIVARPFEHPTEPKDVSSLHGSLSSHTRTSEATPLVSPTLSEIIFSMFPDNSRNFESASQGQGTGMFESRSREQGKGVFESNSQRQGNGVLQSPSKGQVQGIGAFESGSLGQGTNGFESASLGSGVSVLDSASLGQEHGQDVLRTLGNRNGFTNGNGQDFSLLSSLGTSDAQASLSAFLSRDDLNTDSFLDSWLEDDRNLGMLSALLEGNERKQGDAVESSGNSLRGENSDENDSSENSDDSSSSQTLSDNQSSDESGEDNSGDDSTDDSTEQQSGQNASGGQNSDESDNLGDGNSKAKSSSDDDSTGSDSSESGSDSSESGSDSSRSGSDSSGSGSYELDFSDLDLEYLDEEDLEELFKLLDE